jgi:hypothetical protein
VPSCSPSQCTEIGLDAGPDDSILISGRELGAQPCAPAQRAVHEQAPTERFDPVGKSTQAASFGHLGPAAPVVSHLDDHCLRPVHDRDGRAVGFGVLGDVGQPFGLT